MTKQSELALYKKALIDWEKPIDECIFNYTECGFCFYFKRCHSLNVYHDFEEKFPILYNQKLLKDDPDHYDYSGCTKTGRQQRVTALKNAIEILEIELKGEV